MKKTVNILILVIIFSYVPDLFALYTQGLKSLPAVSYIKYLREILVLIVSFILFIKSISKSKNVRASSVPFLILTVFFIITVLINLLLGNFKAVFLLKTIASVGILFVVTNQERLEVSYRLIKALFFIHISSQLIEAIFLPNIMSFKLLGLNVRSTGIMPMPSSAAIISILLSEILYQKNFRGRKLLGLLTFFSIILSASGLGLLVFSFLTLKKTKYLRILTLPLLTILLLSAPSILGRADLAKSLKDRFSNWTNLQERISLINLDSSGLYTNANAAYERENGNNWEQYVTDGDFLSILLNFGSLPFLIYLIALTLQGIREKTHKKVLWITLVLFSLTLNFLEFTLAVVLLAILVGNRKINVLSKF
jgi:hypothetical protein